MLTENDTYNSRHSTISITTSSEGIVYLGHMTDSISHMNLVQWKTDVRITGYKNQTLIRIIMYINVAT